MTDSDHPLRMQIATIAAPTPQATPPFGRPNPDAFGRCNYCYRQSQFLKWLNRREGIWVWVCKLHLKRNSHA